MKRFFSQLNSWRVPVVVLSALFVIFNSYGIASAATTDDLREVIGDRRVTDDSFMSDLKNIIYRYRQTEYRSELIDLLNSMGDNDYEDRFNELNDKKDKTLSELEETFKSNQSTDKVIEKLNDSVAVLKELGAVKEPNSIILNSFDENDYEDAYIYATSVLETMNDDYNIGIVGEGLTLPTADSKKMKRAFGQNAIVTSDVVYEDNKGIDLYTGMNGEDKGFKPRILCQFNGTVRKVTKCKEGYRIEVEHGQALVTIYEFLSKPVVKKGEKVKQYDLLGYAKGESIHFEVILNTVNINPLLMYGDMGEQIYTQWYGANPGMAVGEIDFTKVKKYVSDVEEIKKTDTTSTVVDSDGNETNITFESGYQKPEVPIADYIDEETDEKGGE